MNRRLLFNGSSMRTSNFLIVDGVEMPTPSKMGVSYYDLVEETYTDGNGRQHIEFVRFDVRKLFVEWGYLSQEEQAIILNAGRGKGTFNVSFFDPIEQSVSTVEMYRGDRETSMYSFLEGFADFSGFSLNYVEV